MHSSKSKENLRKKSPAFLFLKLAVVILGVACFSIGGLALYNSCEKRNYDGCYQFKLDLLKNASNEKKAVFVGGSATNFGIHAEKFEKETGLKSYNMGLSAGRSFDAYLESVKPYIHDGDYLFMCPENNYWNSEFHNIDNGTTLFFLYQNEKALRITNFSDFLNYIKYAIYNSWTGWLNSILQLFDELLVDVFHTKEPGTYDRWSCNSNGDFTFHKDKKAPLYTCEKVSSYLASYSFADGLKKYINDWRSTVNFTPVILFPAIDYLSIEGDSGFDNLATLVEERTGIKVLFSQSQVAYPREYFYDTYYHLKWEYAEIHTQFVIEQFINSGF